MKDAPTVRFGKLHRYWGFGHKKTPCLKIEARSVSAFDPGTYDIKLIVDPITDRICSLIEYVCEKYTNVLERLKEREQGHQAVRSEV